MNYQNNMYGQMPYNNGVNYGQQVQPPKPTSTLTKEEIAQLRNKGGAFTLALTQEDVNRGICYHVDEQGNPAYFDNSDGSVTCTVCGKTWFPEQRTQEDVTADVEHILSVLQTIKLMYKNMPELAAREFFQIIPLIEKVPQLYKIAADNFRTYENSYSGYMNGNINPFQLFNQFASGAGFGMGNMYQYQQAQPGAAMYGQPQGQPMQQSMYNQQPAMGYQTQYNPYAQPQQPVGNPLYTQQVPPAGGYAPQTVGYQYQPSQQPVNPQMGASPTSAPESQKAESTANHTA